MNRIRIFAGPNGSGKSILYKSLLAQNHFHDCYYVNADEIINSRYIKSMKNLPLAVPYTARTYLFDNSGENFINIASIIGGRTVNIHVDKIPLWFENLFPPI